MSAASYEPGPGGVLAYVDEQGRLGLARKGPAPAQDVVELPLSLYEAEPVSAGADEMGEGPLAPDDLLRRDRTALAEAVARAREEGIDAWGWIAAEDDPEPLVTCADALDAGVIVLPVELVEGTLPTRWREERLEVVTHGSVSLVVVDRAGHLVGPA